MTREWVQHEIRELLDAPNTAKNAYDLAVLYILLDHMAEHSQAPRVAGDGSADPAKVTQMDEVEKMLGEISVTTVDERRRVREASELARIMA